jgi:hypothetical protein
MNDLHRRHVLQIATAAMTVLAPGALFAQGASPATTGASPATSLFKIVTVKDEIVIGFSADELKELGGDAGGIARTLAAKGTMTVWQYATRKGASGDLEQAPLRKIGLLAHDSLRVEPYATPLKVLPHE